MFKKYFIKSIKKSKIDRIFYKIDKNGQNSFSLENYRFLTIFVDFCPIFVDIYPFLSIFAYFCRFLSFFIDFCPFCTKWHYTRLTANICTLNMFVKSTENFLDAFEKKSFSPKNGGLSEYSNPILSFVFTHVLN